jgi:hypothetical protein
MESTAICRRASGCGAGFHHLLVRYGLPYPCCRRTAQDALALVPSIIESLAVSAALAGQTGAPARDEDFATTARAQQNRHDFYGDYGR